VPDAADVETVFRAEAVRTWPETGVPPGRAGWIVTAALPRVSASLDPGPRPGDRPAAPRVLRDARHADAARLYTAALYTPAPDAPDAPPRRAPCATTGSA
jgi:RNA polymerase sigma-70 factor (ECF subfamily)